MTSLMTLQLPKNRITRLNCFFIIVYARSKGLHKIARLLIPVCNHTEIYYIIMGVI